MALSAQQNRTTSGTPGGGTSSQSLKSPGTKLVSTLNAQLILAAIAFATHSSDLPRDYQTLVKFFSCSLLTGIAWQYFLIGKTRWTWVVGSIAILFSPFIQLKLHADTWKAIDAAAAIVICLPVFSAFMKLIWELAAAGAQFFGTFKNALIQNSRALLTCFFTSRAAILLGWFFAVPVAFMVFIALTLRVARGWLWERATAGARFLGASSYRVGSLAGLAAVAALHTARSLPSGEPLHDMLSSELPERANLGAGPVITKEALANALNYPGGSEQYKRDQLLAAETGSENAVPPVRQAKFVELQIQNVIEENKSIISLSKATLHSMPVFKKHRHTMELLYPLLRTIPQQEYFLRSTIDDGTVALHANDMGSLARSIQTLLLGHVIIASFSGSYSVPDYVWSVLESINHDEALALRDAMDDAKKVLSGGCQIQDFGVKWFPYLKTHGICIEEMGQHDLTAINPKGVKQVANAVVSAIAVNLSSRIGPQLNLGYLWKRLDLGMTGYDQDTKYGCLTKFLYQNE